MWENKISYEKLRTGRLCILARGTAGNENHSSSHTREQRKKREISQSNKQRSLYFLCNVESE